MALPKNVDAATEPTISGLSEKPVSAVKRTWLYFCANPNHPGLLEFSLKDPNSAILRAFESDKDPAAETGGAPVCPVCKTTVVAYPIEAEGDIPEVIRKAPY